MLVVSGCVAKKGKSTITWTVNDIDKAHSTYFKDLRVCKSLGIKFNKKDRPTRGNLPYEKKDKEYLVFKSDQHHKIHMINVAKYYQNEQLFLDLLRFSLQYFKQIIKRH